MTVEAEIVVLPDAEALAHHAAQCFVALAREAVDDRGRFSVALSGGSTPGALYRLLADEPYRSQIPWAKVHLFWGDERCVPPGDPGSNYRLAEETLVTAVPIPPDNVHRIRGELEPEEAARAYAQELRDFFRGSPPQFDLVLLGLGEDGHTASLFPGSPALCETARLVVAAEARFRDRPAWRVTLTLPILNAARQVLFLVVGSAKAGIVQAVLEGPGRQLPGQQVQPMTGRLTWLLDAAAANQLRQQDHLAPVTLPVRPGQAKEQVEGLG